MIEFWQKKQNITVMWFVAKGRTHSLELRWLPLMLALCLCFVIIVLGFISLIYVFYLSYHRSLLSDERIHFKEQLFVMQSQYENVFAEVYPEELGARSDDQPAFEPVLPFELAEDMPEDLPQELTDLDFLTLSLESTEQSTPTLENIWHLESLAIKREENQKTLALHVDYRLSYRQGGDVSTGYVWGILAYRLNNSDADDSLLYVAAPDERLLGAGDDKTIDYTRGDRFHIRRYRDQTLTFTIPVAGQVVWVKLQTADIDGRLDADWQKNWSNFSDNNSAASQTSAKANSVYSSNRAVKTRAQ